MSKSWWLHWISCLAEIRDPNWEKIFTTMFDIMDEDICINLDG